ncbi:DUF1653 domain-containing protein [Candidatus Falkowbacteria bacterium CG10_big_fil_rev_8_21_14_0_10_39_9]|uniref:DUF1653 domain-containing protein n=1 Tax=Candidatus Falkowbacteria bacterium CG10_big_fil_rev_8_21_14_0_10_39_9 TaxID=1974566 RepID=A0A2M6WQG0_9BACT|nr:MAG: DUF1653 domain-containing protein [Candidatus Falkowbacteria bacterium CG10_big_fil_rev_8_21_14_0_10_39_9]
MLKLGKYQHYKGGVYEVLGVAHYSEDEIEMVVYKDLYGDGQLWVRPLAIFLEEVEIDGVLKPRFTYLD